jgi:hypothetical protein
MDAGRRERRSAVKRRTACGAAGFLAAAALAAYLAFGRSGEPSSRPAAPSAMEAREQAVKQFCSHCHLFPPPDTLPRAFWAEKVRSMYAIAKGDAESAPAAFPPLEDAIDFYERRAPEALRPIDTTAGQGPGPLRLASWPLKLQGFAPYPGVSNVRFAHLFDDERLDLVICEMRYGLVLVSQPYLSLEAVRIAGRVPHPCHAEVVDLDRDGRLDLLVADLGTPTPSDVQQGSIVWLRGAGEGRFEQFTIASGLGRVADVQAADFDGDGDLDLVAAVFGWRKVGEILYLENRTTDYRSPQFVASVIDPRPGAIHVPIADLDGDGRPDFVALISQHFETVVAFLNRGGGTFEPRTIFTAEHPNWGSTGIQLVDFDGDGDLDVLFSNGDSLDDLIVKPYHGIQWLENRGSYPFAVHRLTDLYGANAARAGDLDNDGDLDVVASVFLPYIRADDPGADKIESLIWLEQTSPGRFRRHSLETVTCSHPTLDLGDYDADGDVDIVTGNMTMAKLPSDSIESWILLLENLRN